MEAQEYKKLVEALRDCASGDGVRCLKCTYHKASNMPCDNALMTDAADAIEALQAQLPKRGEVVRCKECKWYGRVDKRRFYRGMDCLQKHIDTIVPDRDFCSKAEKRG